MMKPRHALLSLLLCAALPACQALAPRASPAAASAVAPVAAVGAATATGAAAPAPATIAERWVSPPHPEDELDSLTPWLDEGGTLWLYATAKTTQRLAVYRADDGRRSGERGGPGTALGQFGRPNGIAAFGDLLFVVERDNHRVQVLSLPGLQSLGTFGEADLKVPYGLWIDESGPGQLEVYVTDSFMADWKTGQLPPDAELDQRVRRFQVDTSALPRKAPAKPGQFPARYVGAFGATSGDGRLRMVESIAGDPAHDRLLIAEEDGRVGATFRDYRIAGTYRGASLPTFDSDAEGIALWSCGPDAGYWIASDQLERTVFRVYDRETLAPRGSFRGEVTSYTDGVALYPLPTAGFPHGAFFALHADRSLAAFDLADVARTLGLSARCLQ